MFKLLLFTSLLIIHSFAFSAPSESLKAYAEGEKIAVYANELDSQKSQLNYEYYFLNFCRGDASDLKHTNENLGSLLLGETTQTTPYDFLVNKPKTCASLCRVTLTEEDVKRFTDMIDRHYRMNFVIDNLPVLTRGHNGGTSHVGLHLGLKNDDKYYIHNHLSFKVELNASTVDNKKSHRIVGFSAIPRSYKSELNEKKEPVGYCEKNPKATGMPDFQELKAGPIFFSYDVEFVKSLKTVETRLEAYKHLGNAGIHWWSLLYSCAVNLVLTLVIGYILKRTVGKDINMYNELRTTEEISEDRGWKQLSRDVFRPPKHPLLLSALIGTGIQIFAVLILALIFVCFGFVNQSARGNLLTTIILFYAFMGTIAGYFSARMYKMFQGPKWLKCTLVTALLYPSFNFVLFYTIDHILITNYSSSSLRFLTAFELVALWFGLSIPLVFLGSLAGYKKQSIQNPSKFNPIPKFIRPVPWYLQPKALAISGGLLPFGSILVELMFVLTSVWEHSFYYLYSYLFAVMLTLVITSALVSIVITYLHLCNGNHRTWWSSFFNTGSVGLYIFIYSIFYFRELQLIGLSSIFIYFGYMLALSVLFMIFCGTIGFLASYWFTKTIYSSIRID